MVQAYNFLASWQLFPEKTSYENGLIPKSKILKIEELNDDNSLKFYTNLIDVYNESSYNEFVLSFNNQLQVFSDKQFAHSYIAQVKDSSTIHIQFFNENNVLIVDVVKSILSNGFLKITHKYFHQSTEKTNVEIFHKQLSVLPYASSSSSVAIKPTQEGVIKHKALWAMEEQTNMQLDQIKQQIELLAKQAQDLQKRKQLSLMIYESKLSFKPQIGHTYHLYQKKDDTHILSLIAPTEWGGSGPFKAFVSSVKLLADHTWVEI